MVQLDVHVPAEQEVAGGKEMIARLRLEAFNLETEARLAAHPLLAAAEAGELTMAQRRAFAAEQHTIQRSDLASFAVLMKTSPRTATAVTSSSNDSTATAVPDLYEFLHGGEAYAAPMLKAYAKSVGFNDEKDMEYPQYNISEKAQGYPSYWARLALSNQRAAGAAACAVNFPAWGQACKRLSAALSDPSHNYTYSSSGNRGEDLAFLDFFGTPIDNLDEMAAAVIDGSPGSVVSYEDLVTPVRLMQAYELLFWDACYEAT